MKKLLITLSVIGLLLVGCSKENTGPIEVVNKVELNAKDVDMSVYPNMNVQGHAYKKVSFAEANRMFEEGGTGILFYGYPGCGFCTKAVPVLNDVALEMGVTVYYIDTGSNDDDEAYNKFVELANDYLIQEDGKGQLYVPNVFAIKDGKIMGNHLSLTDDYQGGALTDSQTSELTGIYQSLFNSLVK